MIFYLYDSTNAITRQEGEKSSNRKNNKRSLSEFETVSVSARKGLFFCKNFCSLLDNRIWVTRKNPDFILLIPRFRENAAAFTTLLAELCSMMLCIRCSRGLVTVSADRRTVGSVLCGCVGIVLVCTGVKATGSAQSHLHSGGGAGLSGCIRSHPAGHEKSAGAGISGKSEAEVPENILNGQDPLRGRTLSAAGLFQKNGVFWCVPAKSPHFFASATNVC